MTQIVGRQAEICRTVTAEMTAQNVGSGSLPVLATPALIALFEGCCAACIIPFLEPEQTSVGSFIQTEHLAPTPVGCTVTVNCTVTAVDGRTITFSGTASDSGGEIGSFLHKRVVVDAARFMAKTAQKHI